MSNGSHVSSVILTSIITSAVTAVLSVLVMERLKSAEPKEQAVVVPDLSGLSLADARLSLEGQGLLMVVAGRKASTGARPDTIVAQTPLAASRVNRGSTVSVTLAGELPLVPELTGRTLAEATVLLERGGYKIFIGPQMPSDNVPEGRVVKQEPAAGTSYEEGRTVVINFSSGPEAKEVPKVIGMNVNRAKEMLEKAGFKVGSTRWAYNEDYSPYIVLQQQPAAGDKAKPGTAVDLVVNED